MKFTEDKQEMCDAIRDMLLKTSAAGNPLNNALAELRYFTDEDGEEWVRPIFEDGCGSNGYYDVRVTGDSNLGILYDVFNKFIRRMW